MAKLCAANPGRLVGVACVDLHRPMDAVRELRRCVRFPISIMSLSSSRTVFLAENTRTAFRLDG